MCDQYPNAIITFVIEYAGQFLLIRRPPGEKNFPNCWAFPGGKIESGETFVQALRREVTEETGLRISNEVALLDGYALPNGSSTGIAFLVRALSNNITSTDCADYRWVQSWEQLRSYEPRIPGIDNHFQAALRELERGRLQDLEELNLTHDKYLNN